MASAHEIRPADLFRPFQNRRLFPPKQPSPTILQLFPRSITSPAKSQKKSTRRGGICHCRSQNRPTLAALSQISPPKLLHFFRSPPASDSANSDLLQAIHAKISSDVVEIKSEQCFNVEISSDLSSEKLAVLKWLLQETYEPEKLSYHSFLDAENERLRSKVVEVGPRMSFSTAWSSNSVSICHACGLTEITRIERSRRYLLLTKDDHLPLPDHHLQEFASMVCDKMTECTYPQKLTSLSSRSGGIVEDRLEIVQLMERGPLALEEINSRMGLAFDKQDIEYYTNLFVNDMKRNPTTVELFDIAQSNSEHSRHWVFNGKIIMDGNPMEKTMMQLVKRTLQVNVGNSVIAFNDNSSAIKGFPVNPLRPVRPGSSCRLEAEESCDMDILFTAETHNFPCAVAPCPGAETGVGGRIRDTHATGRGSFLGAATAGYCVGNLNVEGSYAPWEDPTFTYPPNLASPLRILIEASNGASDYANKFGEPLIQGYTRAFGMRLPCGERREWVKPIMFSGGIGQIDHSQLFKGEPEVGMLVVKIGGPAYRIGMGGGAASSMVSGQNQAELDFNAVQRGDAEMGQKLYRVVRTCAELGERNPIVSIHDQGAGGNCNVVKEIVYPKGAVVDVRAVVVGDRTMSVLEIWGAEYQEQDAILVRPESRDLLQKICDRERLPMAVTGTVSGDGRIVLVDSLSVQKSVSIGVPPPPPAVDLELDKVLGNMPQKCFKFHRVIPFLQPLDIAPEVTAMESLKRVLRLPSVCSKRFLTTKADRCVTGLVAQQQTVGPLQITLSDVAVIAQTHSGITGAACAIGEQPMKGLLNPEAMARMAVGEVLTNLVWASVTSLSDVKASGNWMYAAKLDGEGAAMYDAAVALSGALMELGVAIDGGKDSLSMAANVSGEVVKAPGNLVISAYVTCTDITKTVTPDLKLGDDGVLLHIDLAEGRRRLGGSALAQAFGQVGDDCPDLDDVRRLKTAFEGIQSLISSSLISAGHDISDGGLLVCTLEMAFSGNCGLLLELSSKGSSTVLETLFAEELGVVVEISRKDLEKVSESLQDLGICFDIIGRTMKTPMVEVKVDGVTHVQGQTADLRDMWEETSFMVEKLQRLPSCVDSERAWLKKRSGGPDWTLSFPSSPTHLRWLSKPKVGVIREEGSNGDREMAAAFHSAGFEVWDVSMSDILDGSVTLREFRGIAFVGGFSYGDVLDSAKGWAGSIRFDPRTLEEFDEFYSRPDSFSLGVCNGCQLMALLGWVPGPGIGGGDLSRPRFVRNISGRYECRFVNVKIERSPAVMLSGMEGSRLGVWVAHGEGRALFPEGGVLDRVVDMNLAPLRYCDDEGEATEEYPFNVNGSPLGIAAMCSPDGRHLAMMPHPERCFMMWQFPWLPRHWEVDKKDPSPWLRLFRNAREWCS